MSDTNFYGKMKDVKENVSITENGMEGYKHTDHALVDFNFKVASYRTNKGQAVTDFNKVLKEGEKYTLKYMMYLRDAREGLGERDLFKTAMLELLKSNVSDKDEIVYTLIAQTPEYGRWDDLWVLLDTSYKADVIAAVKAQLAADMKKLVEAKGEHTESISLLGKWMPSENASSRETKRLAHLFISELGATPRSYRKMLSALRGKLNVVETLACANEWEKIDYNTVPSKANLKYKNAFLAHDEERRRTFLSKAIAGDKEVKVHMAVAFPHEIVHKYTQGGSYVRGGYDQSLEAYWKNLKPCVGLKDTIVVRDGSGSMTCRVGGTDVTAMDISTALAVYCSQYLSGSFKNKFITFSSQAQLVDLSGCGSLQTKLQKTYGHGDCSTTNIQGVFELILKTAWESNMKPEDMPSTVLIISDMEFNPAANYVRGYYDYNRPPMNAESNVFKTMDAKFKAAGYQLPKLAFWNVNSRTCTIPCKYNENGVLLISGFSQNVLSMVMNGKTDPYDALIEELNKARYESIPLVSFNGVGSSTSAVKTPKGTRKSSVRKTKKVEMPEFLR